MTIVNGVEVDLPEGSGASNCGICRRAPCDSCGRWIADHEEIPGYHLGWDEDPRSFC